MAGLTDDKAALIQMNHAMQKVTEQMERLAIGAGMAGHAIQKDFTEQIAHLHWVSSAIFDTMPFDGSRHGGGGFAGGRYFGDMESGVLGGRSFGPVPARRSGGGLAGPSLPPSMRPRKYSGMGGPTDFFPHLGSEFATGYLMQALLKKGTPDMLEGLSKLHAHLQGGREMSREEFVDLYTKARNTTNDKGEAAFSKDFLRKLSGAARMARNKHEHAESHQAGLRMRGKLQDQQSTLAEQQRTKSTRDGTKVLDEFNAKLSEFAHSTVKAGVMYGGVALQSSSPDAFATLTGSFKLLAATMGTELVPLAAHASRSLQNAAHSFERMDPGLKKFYTNLFLVGTATAGVIAALPRIIQLFKGLTTAAALGLEALKGAIGFASAHPRLAGAGLAVGTATAAGAYFTHQVYNQNEQLRTYAEANKRSQEERTPEKIRQSTFYQRMLELPEGERDAFLRQEEHNADEMFKHRRNQLGEMLESPGFTGGVKKWANRFFQDEEIRGLQRGMAQHEGDRDMIRDIIKLRQGKFQMSPEAQKARDSARMSANSMLLDFQSRVQPAYYGIEDMGKKIQLEALGTSPLQEEIRRIQIQQLDVLLQIAGYSKEQAAELKRNSGLP